MFSLTVLSFVRRLNKYNDIYRAISLVLCALQDQTEIYAICVRSLRANIIYEYDERDLLSARSSQIAHAAFAIAFVAFSIKALARSIPRDIFHGETVATESRHNAAITIMQS